MDVANKGMLGNQPEGHVLKWLLTVGLSPGPAMEEQVSIMTSGVSIV